MRNIRIFLTVGLLSLAQLSYPAIASGVVFRIDTFMVNRNGSLFFEDTFTDELPPPSAPNFPGGNPASYITTGSFGPESGGKLSIDSARGALTEPTFGEVPFLIQSATLRTNTDSADLVRGLKVAHTFEVVGIFDLVIPSARQERYGIQLRDRTSTNVGNDNLELVVRRTVAGNLRIQFRRFDFEMGTVTTYSSVPLDPNQQQISLTLSKPSATSNSIRASFAYVDGGVMGPVTTLPFLPQIFRGENFTRAGFTAQAPFFPGALRASVGYRAVYLNWDPPPIAVDGYNIFVDRYDSDTDRFVSLGTVNPPGFLIPNTKFNVYAFANGQVVENGQLYRFTIQAIENGVESGFSNSVLARPNEFAVGQIPVRPEHPILFLHGIGFPGFSADASTWDTTKEYLKEGLGWKFGCELATIGQSTNARDLARRNCENGFRGDFFTATFGNDSANYDDGRGIGHQADEVGAFVTRILNERSNQRLPFKTLTLVAHSMGGLAARSYLASAGDAARNQIFDLITYGTPHAGAPRASIFEILPLSKGAEQMAIDCFSGVRVNSPFLLDLRGRPLPDLRYVGIVGHMQNSVWYSVWYIPEHRKISGCFSTHWDGVVTIDSADWSDFVVPRRPQLLFTSKFHIGDQTADFSAILCALNPNCFVVSVASPVDVEVTGPDGNAIARDKVEIPGATYTELNDEIDHSSAFVVIPFPLPGPYEIKVVPKDEATPTDTFSVHVSQNGRTTLLAENEAIQNIPPQPFVLNIAMWVEIDIHPGGFPNTINHKSRGRIAVAILSKPGFDPTARVDRQSLTFGRTGDEASLAFCAGGQEDLNGDGVLDLVCHFYTELAGFQPGDPDGVLKGQTLDGLSLTGTDSVRVMR